MSTHSTTLSTLVESRTAQVAALRLRSLSRQLRVRRRNTQPICSTRVISKFTGNSLPSILRVEIVAKTRAASKSHPRIRSGSTYTLAAINQAQVGQGVSHQTRAKLKHIAACSSAYDITLAAQGGTFAHAPYTACDGYITVFFASNNPDGTVTTRATIAGIGDSGPIQSPAHTSYVSNG